MDAVIENMKNSFESSVKKVISGNPKKDNWNYLNKSKQLPKVFGSSLCQICQRESNDVPIVVQDICSFIQEKFISCEGIFRLSAPSFQTAKLRQAFENHVVGGNRTSVCVSMNVDGHTAANVLKQFLRQLTEPLIPEEVMKTSQETKCLSDETFAAKVRHQMNSWPAPHQRTLQHLLAFLQPVMRDEENRMNARCFSVVFGPNVFRISSGMDALEMQTLANSTFERLLRVYDVICDRVKDDQGYLKITAHLSPSSKPARPAPPVPMQARPLPPPPVPVHAPDDLIVHRINPPPVPPRTEEMNLEVIGDSSFFQSYSCSDHSDCDENPLLISNEAIQDIVDKTISHVVRKRLFTTGSSSSSRASSVVGEDAVFLQGGDPLESGDVIMTSLLPSLTLGRNNGPKRRKPTRHHLRVAEESNYIESNVTNELMPVPMPRKLSRPTPGDSVNATKDISPTDNVEVLRRDNTAPHPSADAAETEVQSLPSAVKNKERVFEIPTFVVEDFSGEDAPLENLGMIPRLDLSEVAPTEEGVTKSRLLPLPRKDKESPSRARRRRKAKKSSANQMNHPKVSEPSPNASDTVDLLLSHDVIDGDNSPLEGSTKWRDAWSTDDESIPMTVAMESYVMRDDQQLADDDIDRAPSSPEHQAARHRSPYSRRHRRRHRRHSNQSSPQRVFTSSQEPAEDHEMLIASLQTIIEELKDDRLTHDRPEDLTLMTRDQIRAEKASMQRELLKHEEVHGRPQTKREKEIMRSVYERYRTVKRLLADSTSSPFKKRSERRAPDAAFDFDVNALDRSDEFMVTQKLTLELTQAEADAPVSGDLDVCDLERQQTEARGEKKRLRRKLKEFENEIEQQYGRSITQADKVVMASEYQEYRALKAKIRLLGALMEKQAIQR